ncbi:uncharacterized protein J4E79_005194 [Alternaria viburni]|uniref:uncharacterized protein n=1 Tax=Alternaria viburni TaxID=566460 RepID=UPI0020C43238|nr:uncharacterized protein J4E79_005194 [Alternaria viburni]KAI4661381.1 hypothetical protein J4E79_005194 [Alternaria viburni]
MVYSYLNFPVGGYIWVDCPGRWRNSCSHASHFSLYSNGKRPWLRHATNGVFQVRRKIEKLQFSRRYSNLRHMRACLVKTDNDDDDDSSDEDDYFESWEENKNWCLAERNILGVNKEIRSELMDLVFGRTEIDFDDVLTLKHSPQGPFALYTRVQWPDTVFWLRLLPSTLAHMTSITIPGKRYVEDYRSLSFIATHAINLRRLTFIWTRYYNNIDMANRLVETLQRVKMIAKKLQTLRFVVKGYNSTRKDQEFILEKLESGFTESNIRRLVHEIDTRS